MTQCRSWHLKAHLRCITHLRYRLPVPPLRRSITKIPFPVGQRLTGIAVPILIIPTVSFFAVAVLSATPWGTIYQTLRGYGAEEKTAQLHLEGIPMSHIDLAVALHAEGAWIRMQVRGKETEETKETKESKEVKLTVPASWKLQEVRGVHVQDVDTQNYGVFRTLAFPQNLPLEFVFETKETMRTLIVSQEDDFPALLTFTQVQWPEKEVHRTTKIIQGRSIFSLF